MNTARLVVTRVGPHVSIQDGGRPGLMRYGVTSSGPMDRFAFTTANLALDNDAAAPGIEISIGGLALSCTQGEVGVAVAGGGFQVLRDDEPLAAWTSLTLRAGMTLTIRPGLWGSWCYIAFAGALQTERWLGSASTHGALGLGGGRLAPQQALVVDSSRTGPPTPLDLACPSFARPRREYRIVRGPQDRFFDAQTLQRLTTAEFTLSDAYDRMGVRLGGPSLQPAGVLTMPSEAVWRGSLQVSGDGVATVLLADHQTTGGYPKIATLVSADATRFVQLRSRDRIQFREVSAVESIGIARTADRLQRQQLAFLRALVQSGR